VARTATARGEGRKIDSADANRAATLNTPEHIVIAIFPATHPEINPAQAKKADTTCHAWRHDGPSMPPRKTV